MVFKRPQKRMNADNLIKLENNLALLYGREAISTIYKLKPEIEKWKEKIQSRAESWNESDSFLITYGGPFERTNNSGLSVLEKFLVEHVEESISTIHILPFYPSTSDGGCSVGDCRKIDDELGNWNNIEAISEKYRLTFDCVLNHVSKSSSYVQGHIDNNPDYINFCIEEDPSFDYSNVTRPRTTPLFHTYDSNNSEIKLWTTFSEDQVDLNFSNPNVLLEIVDVVLFYASKGASILRLDAIPYIWKESGTACVHMQQTHAFIRILRIILEEASPHVLILTETNVPHHENLSYF